jgi:hypothetical protein
MFISFFKFSFPLFKKFYLIKKFHLFYFPFICFVLYFFAISYSLKIRFDIYGKSYFIKDWLCSSVIPAASSMLEYSLILYTTSLSVSHSRAPAAGTLLVCEGWS